MNSEANRKVGAVIIMHSNHNNFGTSLQGYATTKVLEKLGYQFRIIRYIRKRTIKEIITTVPFILISGGLKQIIKRLSKKTSKKIHRNYAHKLAKRTATVNQFKKKYFDSISDYYTGYKELCRGSKNYDIVFVGSDQVWGPLSLYSKFYNLLFVDKSIPTFSYASSFGVSKIFSWQKKSVKEYLDKLDAVGVREIKGKEIVDSLSINTANVVADPTLLLSKSDWENYSSESTIQINEPYLLAYVLGKRKDIRDVITRLAKQLSLKVVYFPHVDGYEPEDENFGNIPIWDANALDYVKLYSHAKYVCTDSFHGTIFSIIFEKQFLTFYRQVPTIAGSTHSRIDSLLKIFGLQQRLFNIDAYQQITQQIDYQQIEKILIEYRNKSLDFFKDSLEITKNQNINIQQ